MNSPAPLFKTTLFNDNAFNFTDYLTKTQADGIYLGLIYLPTTFGVISASKLVVADSSLSIQGINQIGFTTMNYGGTIVISTATELNYLHGSTPGASTASNALVVDSSRNITNINSLTATNLIGTNLTGTLQTAAQSNITSLGSLSALTMFGDITMSGHNIASANTITATTLTGLLSTATQGNITSLGSLSALTMAGTITMGSNNISGAGTIGCATLNVSSAFNVTATTDSTSPTTGAITSAGGLGVAKTLTVAGQINCTNSTTNAVINIATSLTSARSTLLLTTDAENWEFGARGSTASNANNLYIYNGGYRLLMNASGDTSILSTTASTSTSTGSLKVSGGLGIAGNTFGTQFTSTNNGNNYSLVNGANSALIELNATPLLRLVNGFSMNVNSTGVMIATANSIAPRFALDFYQQANDVILSLYQPSGGGSVYGFGASNTSLNLHSAGSFTFYNGTTGNGSLGTNVLSVSSGGNVTAGNNVFATSYFATGFSSSGLSGPGLKMHYGSSTGQIFAYNYTTSAYIPMSIGNSAIQVGTNGGININTSNQVTTFPLSIYGTGSATRTSGNYGYLNSSGAGNGGTANFTRNFSIYCDAAGILIGAGEIDCFSDERLKDNIVELNDELCNRFINNIKPISFNYKKNLDKTKYGFSAQELIKNGFNALIGIVDGNLEENLEEQNIECINDNIFHLPSDMKLTVSMLDMIPILHKCIQKQQQQINSNKEEIQELKKLILNNLIINSTKDQSQIKKKTYRVI